MDKHEENKRLIEVDFPLREVSEQSVREKTIRHGHISTLHIWWARRPLASSRATALAALLPDPGDDAKRQELLKLIKHIAPWEVVSKQTPQNTALLEKARKLILEANGGKPPKVLDCFAGGGSIPLEALRLGCDTYALDYNPVAVLILKAVLDYPQKFGRPVPASEAAKYGLPVRSRKDTLGLDKQETINPLLEAVRYWGNWVLEEARKELERFYPKDRDGSIPVGYIWARTLPCQNPECGAEIPLMRQTWLAKKESKDEQGRKKEGKKVALRMVADKRRKRVDFEVVEGKKIDFGPDDGTVSRAHVRCPICGSTTDDDTTRKLFREGKAGQRMVVVVLHHPDRTGKTYRLATDRDLEAYGAAEKALPKKREALWSKWAIDPVPDEEIPTTMSGGIHPPNYGMYRYGDLFNARQKLTLITCCESVRRVSSKLAKSGTGPSFAEAVSVYLALSLDRLADFFSTLCQWENTRENVKHVFTRPALPMLWDYIEAYPFSGATGSAQEQFESVLHVISHCSKIVAQNSGRVTQGSATQMPYESNFFDAVITDPPYYINVPYADLSDFFYVWLKRTLSESHPDLLATPLTPKSAEIGQLAHWDASRYSEKDKRWFELMLTKAFGEVERVLKPDGIAVIVYAYPKTEAWESVVNAIISSRLYLTGSWPIHTEMTSRLMAQESAALASSIYMVCRRRTSKEVGEFPQVKTAIERRVRERLTKFWNEGIRGADFFMSAIGPAVEVFGRFERVEKLSGETVEVRELLDYVQKVVSEYALERILGSTELGGVDPETRFYLLWRWTHNSARVPFDEGNKLALAVGTELKILWEKGGLVSKEKEYVRVLGPRDREKDAKFMNQVGFNTMVDALHRAVLYWEHGQRQKLKEHLAQTYGANDTFWRVAQNIADVLPDGDKEKQLLQGLLYGSKAHVAVAQISGKLFGE